MKKILSGIAVFFLFQTVIAQTSNDNRIPQPVLAAFTQKFPDGQLQKWENRKEGYIATFTTDGKEHLAYYSPDGRWQATEAPVKWTWHLPQSVQAAWNNSEYTGWYVHKIKRVHTPEGQLYVLHLNNGPLLSSDKYDAFREDHVLYFTAEGALVRTERI